VGLNSESWSYVKSIYPGGVLGLLSNTQDEVWDFFKKLAWNTYEFEQVKNNFGYPTPNECVFHANPYPHDRFMHSHDPPCSCVSLVLCKYCDSHDQDTCNCPYRAYVDATCASGEKEINELTDKMIENLKVRIAEYSQCLSQIRENYSESDSSLESPKPRVSLYDDFEPSYSARPTLNEEMPLPSLDQESDFPLSLSPALAPEFSSPTDIIEDVLVSADPPTTLNDSFVFEEGDDWGNPSELYLSITADFEHHELDESDDTLSPESCAEEATLTKLEFNDDILSIEYESFSCGFDVNVGLDVNLCAEYESFSFDPIHPNFLCESHKSKFVESEAIVPEHFDLDQTPTHIELKELVDLELTNLPRPFIHDDILSRPMTHLLATFEYVYPFFDWAQQFDKLKRALTYAALLCWMYSIWC